MRTVTLLILCGLTLSYLGSGHPVRAAEPSADEIEQARGAAILRNSLALVEATASELGRTADKLDALASTARRPQLPPSETEALLRRGPAALAPLAAMPSDFTAPAAGQAFAAAAADHRAVAQMLKQAAAEASTLPIAAALEKIRSLHIPADHTLIVFPPDSAGPTNIDTTLSAINRSSPLTLSGVDTFIVGVGSDARTIDYPAIGSLLESENGEMVVICTGSLVGPSEFLTAAHCLCHDSSAALCAVANDKNARAAEAEALRVYLPHSGLYTIGNADEGIVINPNYAISIGTTGDLAILHLSMPVFDVIPMPINNVSLPVGAAAEIVGFGVTNLIDQNGRVVATNVSDATSAGIKLLARVEIGACPSGLPADLLCWKYRVDPTKNLGSTCGGDSGGPVIATYDGRDVLAAVVSGGLRDAGSSSCLPGQKLFNTDVANQANHKWLINALAKWGAPIASTVQPLLEPTINAKGRYLGLSPDIGSHHTFYESPAKMALDAQLANDSKLVIVGLNGTFSNASLSLTVTNIANGDKLCTMAGTEPAKVCAFASTGIDRVRIEVVGRQFQEVQVVATSFSAQ